jgi:hypothetical protein
MKTLFLVLFLGDLSNRIPMPYSNPSPVASAVVDNMAIAEAKIRTLNGKLMDAKLQLAAANGQIETLEKRLTIVGTEYQGFRDKSSDNTRALDIAYNERDSALAEVKRLTGENLDKDKKLARAAKTERNLVALQFISFGIILMIGVVGLWLMRRYYANIIARLPNQDTEEIIQNLKNLLKIAKGELALAESQYSSIEIANNAVIELLRHRVGELNEDLSRLAALQKGTEATVARLTLENTNLAEENVFLQGNRKPSDGETERLINDGVFGPPITTPEEPSPLHEDPGVVEAQVELVDALEKSRGPMIQDEMPTPPITANDQVEGVNTVPPHRIND